jgi:Ca2+-binding RTX toxin-like protein
VLRGLGGSDVLIGGAGGDTFLWRVSDLNAAYERGDVDRIVDFSTEDRLDLYEWTKDMTTDEILDRIIVNDDGQNSHISIDLGNGHREIAVLENFTGYSTRDMLAEGLLLS